VANKEWADIYLTFDPNFEEEQVWTILEQSWHHSAMVSLGWTFCFWDLHL